MREKSLYDWCIENGDWGKQLLSEFGNGNNSQSYIDENGTTVTPHNFASGSNKKVKWTCNKGHQWYAMIYNRVFGKNKCLKCKYEIQSIRQKIPKQGINDLYTWCLNNGDFGQQLLSEFGNGNNSQSYIDEQGNEVTPYDFSYGTAQKIKWTCSKGHEWHAAVVSRTYTGVGCPTCYIELASIKQSTPKKGINDLYTWCLNNGEWGQQLLYEFGDGNNSQQFLDEETGTYKSPHDFSYGSNIKIKWTCNKGHEWYSDISHRTCVGRGCPICNRTPKQGINDLYTWCLNNGDWGQHLLQEFQGIDENSNKITPKEITYASNTKVLWKCNKGHEWFANISHRTWAMNKCPFCNLKGTSYPEQFLYRAIIQLYPQTINRGKYKEFEYDITIPEEKTCIEYSGINWHADNLERDKIKANICKEHNVRFIQIYAHYGELNTEDIFDNDLIIYKADTNRNLHKKQLVSILEHILKYFGHSISEIDIEKAQTEAFNFMHNIESEDNNGNK